MPPGWWRKCTFRIDEAILREGMSELTRIRAAAPPDKPFVLGVGSVINPNELQSALDMGFDMIVAPANVMGGYGEGIGVRAHLPRAGRLLGPGRLHPDRDCSTSSSAKTAWSPTRSRSSPPGRTAPRGSATCSRRSCATATRAGSSCPPAPSISRPARNTRRPSPNAASSPCSACPRPLALVDKEKKPGDVDCIRRSLAQFREKICRRPAPPERTSNPTSKGRERGVCAPGPNHSGLQNPFTGAVYESCAAACQSRAEASVRGPRSPRSGPGSSP